MAVEAVTKIEGCSRLEAFIETQGGVFLCFSLDMPFSKRQEIRTKALIAIYRQNKKHVSSS